MKEKVVLRWLKKAENDLKYGILKNILNSVLMRQGRFMKPQKRLKNL
jgi:hypothetical protein